MERNPEDIICPDCRGPKSRQAPRCARCSGKGHTSEQRDHLSTPLCGANKKDGSTCRAFAGQGTDHKGIGRCKYHGGSVAAHRQHAVTVDAKRRMARWGTPVENISAPDALLGLLRASAGHNEFLRAEVMTLDSLDTHEARVLLDWYDRERAVLVKVSEACVRAGVAEHVIRMEQTQVTTTVKAIRDAAQDIGLNATQLKALGVALRRRFTEVSGGDAAEVEKADAHLAKLRGQLAADEERRVSSLAERRAQELSGLTFPPAEMLPPDAA